MLLLWQFLKPFCAVLKRSSASIDERKLEILTAFHFIKFEELPEKPYIP